MLIMAGLKDVRREQGANAQEKYFHPQGITLISIFAAIAILLAAGLAYPGQSSSAEEPAADTSGNASLVLAGGGDFGGGVAVHSLSRATLSAATERALVQAILSGTDLEGGVVEGAAPAAPEGTILRDIDVSKPGYAIVRLDFPPGKLSCSSFGGPDADLLTHLIQSNLEEHFGVHYLRILVREQGEPEARYMDLVDRLQENKPLIRKNDLDGTGSSADAADPSVSKQSSDRSPADLGGFPGSTGSWPSGFLSGKGVFLNASHGVVYRSKTNTWGLQRGLVQELNEDIHNAELVSWYLATYLRNAGAQVWPEREMDFQTNMVIVDANEGTYPASSGTCTKTGTWTTVSGKGFKLYTPPLQDQNMPFRAGTGSYQRAALSKGGAATATATFTPKIPAAGYYHVYIAFVGNSDQSANTHIGVRHTGGESRLTITQKRDGNTWLWLGNYYFNAGQDSTKGAVVVYNDVPAGDSGSYVAIDAVRFGGGMGDIQRYDPEFFPSGPYVGSGKERWTEEARYYLQFAGMTASLFNTTCYEDEGNSSANQRDECDGWSARSRYVSFETETGEDTCYLALHTNAYDGTARGLSTYVSPSASDATLSFRNYVHDQIYSDVKTVYNVPTEFRNSKNTGSYGENNQSNLGDSPGFLIELLFHDNVDDCNLYKDPKFRQLCARAMYKGIVKYYANRDGTTAVILPEPPTHVRVQRQTSGAMRVSWHAPASGGVNGNPATGYLVQHSLDGRGFDDGTATTQTYLDMGPYTPAGVVHYFRVIATNAGGISFPSDVVASRSGTGTPKVLFVQGNDRVDRYLLPSKTWFGTSTRFMNLRAINTFDYVIAHAAALQGADTDFDSANHLAVGAGDVNLSQYSLVIWASGQQAEADSLDLAYTFRAFTTDEKTRLRAYATAGGALFVTGSEIWWDMDRSSSVAADDRAFIKEITGAAYAADDAWPSGTVQNLCNGETGSIFAGLSNIGIDDGTHGTYEVRYPDVLTAQSGASVCLRYYSATSSTNVAGVQRLATTSKVVAIGVPFESLYPESMRTTIMQRVVDALMPAPPTPTPSPSPSPSPSPTPTVTPAPQYELTKSLSNTSVNANLTTSQSGWFAFGSGYAGNIMQNSNLNGAGSPLSYGYNNTGSFYANFSAINNSTYPYAVAAMQTITFAGSTQPDQGINVAAGRLYRMKGTVTSSNTNPANNPGIRLAITGRSSVGEGFAEFTQQGASNAATYKHGPSSGLPATLKAFFWPQGAGYCDLLVAIWDTYDNVQGSLTVSNIEIESFDTSKLTGTTLLADMGTGAASQFAVDAISGFNSSATNKFYFAKAALASGGTAPTASADPDPTGPANRSTLSITGTANTDITKGGVAEWLGVNNFTTAAVPKLIVSQFMARTTSGENIKIPTLHLAVQEQSGNMRQGGFLDRKIQGGVKKNDAFDLTSVAAPVRLAIESLPSQQYGLEFFSLLTVDADDNNAIFSGNLTIDRITVTQYDLPQER